MFIPVGFKNYILPISGITFFQYIATAVPVTILFSSLFVYIGSQLKSPEDAINSSDFSSKTAAEKANFILTIITVIVTILLICLCVIYTRKKLKQAEEEEKLNKKKEEQNNLIQCKNTQNLLCDEEAELSLKPKSEILFNKNSLKAD